MSKLPLTALRRMRSETGAVILPGMPVPGSDAWSDKVRASRVRQGFCKEQEAIKKPATKKAKRKSKTAKED